MRHPQRLLLTLAALITVSSCKSEAPKPPPPLPLLPPLPPASLLPVLDGGCYRLPGGLSTVISDAALAVDEEREYELNN